MFHGRQPVLVFTADREDETDVIDIAEAGYTTGYENYDPGIDLSMEF